MAVAISPNGKYLASPEAGNVTTSWEVRVWAGREQKKAAEK
jgi:hypothetical protein